MREQVNALLFEIGLDRNDVQVFEDTDWNGQFMYPNFFSVKDWSGFDMSDEELLDTIIALMEQHVQTATEQLELTRRFKNAFGSDDSENSTGSPAVV